MHTFINSRATLYVRLLIHEPQCVCARWAKACVLALVAPRVTACVCLLSHNMCARVGGATSHSAPAFVEPRVATCLRLLIHEPRSQRMCATLRHNMCARSLSYIECSLMLFAEIIICFQAAKYSLDISKTNNCKRNSNFNIFLKKKIQSNNL